MGKQEEFERLDRTLKDTEVRIRTIQSHTATLDKELSTFISLETTLKENIKCLKTNQIVAIVQEFKKSKEELKRTQARIQVLKSDRSIFCRDIKALQVILETVKLDLEKLKKSENNVLVFIGGKKDG
jgi:prefoldin subunit 5